MPREIDRTLARTWVAAHRHHQRRFTGAICPDKRDDFPFLYFEVDTFERHDLAVEGLHAANGEQGVRHRTALLPPPERGREGVCARMRSSTTRAIALKTPTVFAKTSLFQNRTMRISRS